MLDVDTVLMQVPLRLAQQVADYLRELDAERGSIADAADTEAAVTVYVPGQGSWTRAMVDRIHDEIPYIGAMALIDHCAAHPGQWVGKDAVEEQHGLAPNTVRNHLGALSKVSKKVFGVSVQMWPMQWKKESNVYMYRMDPTIAEWWNAAGRAED